MDSSLTFRSCKFFKSKTYNLIIFNSPFPKIFNIFYILVFLEFYKFIYNLLVINHKRFFIINIGFWKLNLLGFNTSQRNFFRKNRHPDKEY